MNATPTASQIRAGNHPQRLAAAIAPKCIVLFGSVAKGTDGEHSDLDLVVIGGNLPSDFFDRVVQVTKLKRGIRTPADVFPYTEAEFEQMLDNLHVTALDCLSEGVPLHGKDYLERLRPKFNAYVERGLKKGKAAWFFEKKNP